MSAGMYTFYVSTWLCIYVSHVPMYIRTRIDICTGIEIDMEIVIDKYVSIYIYRHLDAYAYVHMWQRLKNIGLVTGPGSLFATRLATESRVLRQTLHATSLLKTTVLSTEASDKGL